MTYTLLQIDRYECHRTRQAKFRPQQGLTMNELKSISKRELAKLHARHPEMSEQDRRNKLDVLLVYKEEK